MAVKVRLMRIGAKGRPFYRVVAVDERRKRTGGYLELLGTYNPLTNPKEINLKQDRIDAWVKNGAQLSDGFLRIIGKAPQKMARKPKKDKGSSSASVPVAVVEKKVAEVTEEPAAAGEVTTKEEKTPEVTSEVETAVESNESPTEDKAEGEPSKTVKPE